MQKKTHRQVLRELYASTGYKPRKPEKLDFDNEELIKLHSRANGSLVNYIRKHPIVSGMIFGYSRQIITFRTTVMEDLSEASEALVVDGDSFGYCEAEYEIILDD